MSETNELQDRSGDKKYFIQIPQIVWGLCQDTYELVLWATIKMIAGEKSECFLSTRQLADAAMMSMGKTSECRRQLLRLGFLEGEKRQDPGYPQPVWHLIIPDLWERNLVWRKQHDSLLERIEIKRKQKDVKWARGHDKREKERERKKSLHSVKAKEPSHCEEGYAHCEEGYAHSETKKNHKEEPKEERGGPFSEKSLVSTWKSALQELELQMTRGTFTRWLAGSELVSLTDSQATIQVRDGYAVDWCASRLRVPIERTLNDVAGNGDLVVKFVV